MHGSGPSHTRDLDQYIHSERNRYTGSRPAHTGERDRTNMGIHGSEAGACEGARPEQARELARHTQGARPAHTRIGTVAYKGSKLVHTLGAKQVHGIKTGTFNASAVAPPGEGAG